jgi:hypothetical protein
MANQLWCANFDMKPCLEHGIANNLWLMQYQYPDAHGHIYQGDKKEAIRKNWERLGEISAGDQFVAYLKPSTFFAIGQVRTPRRSKTEKDPADTITGYLDRKKSHRYASGFVYYPPVLYEDFSDEWELPSEYKGVSVLRQGDRFAEVERCGTTDFRHRQRIAHEETGCRNRRVLGLSPQKTWLRRVIADGSHAQSLRWACRIASKRPTVPAVSTREESWGSMELEGVVHNGVIVPDDARALAEGMRVRISPVPEEKPRPFGERFAQFKGTVPDLTADLAEQHDHYRLGTPKR